MITLTTFCIPYMLSTQSTSGKQHSFPFIIWSSMISNTQKWESSLQLFGTNYHILQQRAANAVSGVIWITRGLCRSWLHLLDMEGDLSQHWQCTEQLWTILRLLQRRRREMEVCFHVLLLEMAPFWPGVKDMWTRIRRAHEQVHPE